MNWLRAGRMLSFLFQAGCAFGGIWVFVNWLGRNSWPRNARRLGVVLMVLWTITANAVVGAIL